MENILNNIKAWDNEKLINLCDKIQEFIKSKSKTVKIELGYNTYKGSGKAWIAKIDTDTKKILEFLKPENTIKDGYRGTKIFLVPDGYYCFCEEGTISYDYKNYYKVINGELEKI